MLEPSFDDCETAFAVQETRSTWTPPAVSNIIWRGPRRESRSNVSTRSVERDSTETDGARLNGHRKLKSTNGSKSNQHMIDMVGTDSKPKQTRQRDMEHEHMREQLIEVYVQHHMGNMNEIKHVY